MWTSLNKRIYLFLGIIFLIGTVVGITFIYFIPEDSKEIIFLNINDLIQNINSINLNNIVNHFIIIASLIILSFFVIGVPLELFFIFYNGFSIGFIISCLVSIFGIRGLLYSLIYIIVTKGVYLFILSIILVSLIKISKLIIDKYILKKGNNINSINMYLKKCLVCLGIILINDLILYFWGASLINIFNFLII